MNPMFDFNAKEINMINMALFAIARTTQMTVDEGVEAPEGFMECLESVVNKMNLVVEARIENDNQFESITESLSDVAQSLQKIVNNPDTPINEYN